MVVALCVYVYFIFCVNYSLLVDAWFCLSCLKLVTFYVGVQVSTFGIGSICIDVTIWYLLVTHVKGSILCSVLLVSIWRFLFETLAWISACCMEQVYGRTLTYLYSNNTHFRLGHIFMKVFSPEIPSSFRYYQQHITNTLLGLCLFCTLTHSIDWLIDCMWVWDLTAPMHLGLIKRALCAPYQNHRSPVTLPKLQMAPKLILLNVLWFQEKACVWVRPRPH